MKKFCVLLVAFGASCLLAPTAEPQTPVSPEMEATVRELMEVTGVADVGAQMMEQMLEPMKRQMPDVPDDVWTGIFAKVDMDGLIDLSIPIYAKHFEQSEIEELVAFYRTPVGRKAVSMMPVIMQETIVVGQQWGQTEARRMFQELRALGYEPPE